MVKINESVSLKTLFDSLADAGKDELNLTNGGSIIKTDDYYDLYDSNWDMILCDGETITTLKEVYAGVGDTNVKVLCNDSGVPYVFTRKELELITFE